MRCLLLTQFPWIAERLARVLRANGCRVVAIAAPVSRHFPWPDFIYDVRPTFLQKAELDFFLKRTEAEALLCWCFPWKISAVGLQIPEFGCVNLHPSLLPKYRGPSPLAWALRNGDREIGVTWHRMTPAFDAGPILTQATFPVSDADSDIMTIGAKVDELGEQLLPEVLCKLAVRDPGTAQCERSATTAPLFSKDEYGVIDWTRSAREIHNQVRAWSCSGMMQTLTAPIGLVDGRWVLIEETSLVQQADSVAAVTTADGRLWVTRVSELCGRGGRRG